MTPNLIDKRSMDKKVFYPFVKKYDGILTDDYEVVLRGKSGHFTKFTGVFLVKRIGSYQARRGSRKGRVMISGVTPLILVRILFEDFWRCKCYS